MSVPFPRGSRSLLVIAFALLGLILALVPALSASAAVAGPDPSGERQPSKIAGTLRDDLHRAQEFGGRVEAVVVLDDTRTPAASSARGVAADLKAATRASQSPVVDTIRDSGDQVVSRFWIKNMVVARLRPDTLRELAALDRVERIIPNFKVWTTSTLSTTPTASLLEGESTWGIEKIGADDVASELGLTGEGVRVAVLDTGVDISHPDLAGKMATDDPADPTYPGGWIEFTEDGLPVASEPHDSEAHGTHVSGTVLGGDASGTQIGVAPGAELMAGLVLPGGEGTFAQVIAGMQWTVAPFDAEGNPAGAPADIVNMSLGAQGHFAEFIEPTQSMRLAGIFPAFAIGNNCQPGRSHGPGNVYDAISVGATDSSDDVGGFSCGEVIDSSLFETVPAEWPDSYVVPNVSAPGVDVVSALPGGQYGPNNGTSMATPHVAGTLALMLEAVPDLTVDEALETLTGTAYFDDRYGAERPNIRFGWGRIDAYAAVTEVALDNGVTGTVADAKTGEPIEGAVVTRTDNGRATQTDAAGQFELRMPEGSYRLEISSFGYETGSHEVTVSTGEFAVVDSKLSLLPRRDIQGKVTYGPTGSMVPGATVEVLDVPVELTAVTNRHGSFSLQDVPEGEYQIVAHARGLPASAPMDLWVASKPSPRQPHLVLPQRTRMSVASDGTEADAYSGSASISADGRYVAFYSVATNLVPGDTNGNDCGQLWPCGHDIFVHDRYTGETKRVSVASDGTEADQGSGSPMISGNGRYVVFESVASNLVAGDTNNRPDIFVHDLRTGTTERVSVASDGTEGDDVSFQASISHDGRYIAFSSWATNLVPGDTNGRGDIFVHDRWTGKTERVSMTAGGLETNDDSEFPSISGNGRYVAYESRANNIVDPDTNNQRDVFFFDRKTGTTERISIATDGTEPTRRVSSGAAVSPDGRYVAFMSGAADLVPGDTNNRGDIFLRDRETGTTERVSMAFDGGESNDNSGSPRFSADGRYLVFDSGASNLVPDDANGWDDVFVLDLRRGTTERVSVGADGSELTVMSSNAAISGDGRFVAFSTSAATVEPGDTNNDLDVFVHDRRPEAGSARFALSDLRLRPMVARPGQHVTASVDVKNLGDAKGTYDAVLRVNGAIDDRKTLTVRANRTGEVTFRLRFGQPGTYAISIGHLTTELTVRRR